MPRLDEASANVPEVIVPPPAPVQAYEPPAPPPPPPSPPYEPFIDPAIQAAMQAQAPPPPAYTPPPPPPPPAYTPPATPPGQQPNLTGDPNAFGFPTTTDKGYTTAGGTAVAAGGLAPTQTVQPDGTTITTFPDGSMWTWYPDNTLNTTTPNPDGTISTTTTLPDGTIGGTTTTAWNPDGSTTTTTTGGGAAHTTTGTGDGTGTDDSPKNPIDWRSYLANWGFPDDVVNTLDSIFRKYDANHVADAQAAALAYIRSTPWYTQHFPGIQDGINQGLFTDEQGYRQYVSGVNDLTQTALGRAPTTDEIVGYIQKGWTPQRVGNFFQAQGFIAADRGLIPQGMFSDDELAKIADVQAGVGGAEGQNLFDLFQYAQQTNPVFLRHFGRNIRRDELAMYQQQGQTPDTLERHFTGQELVQTQRPELEQLTGAFGIGDQSQESWPNLQQYGDQTQGLNSYIGAQVTDRIDKARQRLAAIVQGTLAQPNLGLFGGKRVASGFGRNLQTPDVGA
jgi:hypothetical protein